jgi:cell fate regulator YaaT (PSP1 superfamily)
MTEKKRRRRRRRKPRGEKPPEEEARESSPSTPWAEQREIEKRKHEAFEHEKRRKEEEREVEPQEICSARPVFLAPQADIEEEFLDDLAEPEWNTDADWIRTAQAIVPLTRSRVLADAGDLHFEAGDQVVLSTARGIELGLALETPNYREVKEEVKNRILRRFGYSDSRQMTRNEAKSVEALELCRRLIEERKLNMKLLRVEHLHGGGKAVFYFTAEKRVDFRQLIRDLAGQLHTRIEMRQIGVRDASRMVGGVGPCGQEVCCNRFLTSFSPVSIKMAKVQSLMLNPTKVSGICGRLLCCLEYEYEQYRRLQREAPRVGSEVRIPDGTGRVREVMLIEGMCSVELGDGTRRTCPWHEVRLLGREEQKEGDRKRPGEENSDDG